MGLGLLFLGMDQMSNATDPLRTYDPFIDLMAKTDNPLWGILLGAGLTALVQSSSATTGIVIMLASQGFLSLEGGIALAIGANIGTCFTAVLSALGKPVEAVRAAVVHVLFNVLGALLWIFFIPELADWARSLSPASAHLEGVARLAAETPRQIANANTLFNIANTAVMLMFTGPIARLAVKLVPDRPVTEPETIQPKYLDPVYLETPSVGIDRVRLELVHMGERVVDMLEEAQGAFKAHSHEGLKQAAARDQDIDELHRALLRYTRELGRLELTSEETRWLGRLITVSNFLESTGDLVARGLIQQADHAVDLGKQPSMADVGGVLQTVVGAFEDVLRAIEAEDYEGARAVAARKREIYDMADRELEVLAEGLAHRRARARGVPGRLRFREPGAQAVLQRAQDRRGAHRGVDQLSSRESRTVRCGTWISMPSWSKRFFTRRMISRRVGKILSGRVSCMNLITTPNSVNLSTPSITGSSVKNSPHSGSARILLQVSIRTSIARSTSSL
jgi:phosphate:Na+ symporter